MIPFSARWCWSAFTRIDRTGTPAATAIADAMPAAYPWFCTSGTMRRIGIASRCALMPRPVTSKPSSFFGRSARYGRFTYIGACGGSSMKNCGSRVWPCVSKFEYVRQIVSGYVRSSITSCGVT